MVRSVSGHLEVAPRALVVVDKADRMTVCALEQIQPIHMQNRLAGKPALSFPESDGVIRPGPWAAALGIDRKKALLTSSIDVLSAFVCVPRLWEGDVCKKVNLVGEEWCRANEQVHGGKLKKLGLIWGKQRHCSSGRAECSKWQASPKMQRKVSFF